MPYIVVRNVIRKVSPHVNMTTSRLPSSVFGFIIVACFYALLSLWYRPRVAILGTILFATSSWFLRGSRLGTPEVMSSLSITLVLFWAWLQRTRHPRVAFVISCLAVVGLLYIPGMIWFIALAGIWRGKQLLADLAKLPTTIVVVMALVSLLLLAPFFYSVFITPSLVLTVLGFSNDWSLATISKQLIHIPTYLFVRGPSDALVTTGKAAVLDIFTITMVVLGFYTTAKSWRLDRNKITLALLASGLILCAIGDLRVLTPLLVPIYLLATAGIAFMLEEWLRVFPRNPLARGIATTLLSVAVLLASFYHITNYFIAWPNTPLTKTTFSKRL